MGEGQGSKQAGGHTRRMGQGSFTEEVTLVQSLEWGVLSVTPSGSGGLMGPPCWGVGRQQELTVAGRKPS